MDATQTGFDRAAARHQTRVSAAAPGDDARAAARGAEPRAPQLSRAFRYTLFGLAVHADRPLPGLAPEAAGGAPDLEMRLSSPAAPLPATDAPADGAWYAGHRSAPGEDPTLTIHRDPGGFVLRYADGTRVRVNAAATRVDCAWPPPLTLEDAATYLLGPVCGFVLRRRGVTCLHASAIAIGGGALLVCGPAGCGKSTTAAALAARGHAVLGDDIAALDASPGGVTVRPAYPHLRLWPDSVSALYGAGATLPPLTPNWDKRWLDLASGAGAFHPHPLPVRAIVVLAGREEAGAPRLQPLEGGDAVLAMVANSYMGWLPDVAAQGRDLALFGRLARRVPVAVAMPHADPARLPELCALLEAFARGQGGGAGA